MLGIFVRSYCSSSVEKPHRSELFCLTRQKVLASYEYVSLLSIIRPMSASYPYRRNILSETSAPYKYMPLSRFGFGLKQKQKKKELRAPIIVVFFSAKTKLFSYSLLL